MAEPGKIEFSVVVPVFNSEESLRLLHDRLKEVFALIGSSWELILVNDCSIDNSWIICRELADYDNRVIAINLANNFGQHNAIMCGLSFARGSYVITMDDDLQHPPEEIPKLIKVARDGDFSVVYGQYISRKYGWFKNMCSVAVHGLIFKISGTSHVATSFRIIRKSLAKKIMAFQHNNVVIDILLREAIDRRYMGYVAVEHHWRKLGQSGYSYRKMFAYALDMIFNYTIWPLRLATLLGLVLSILSMMLGAYFFAEYFFGHPLRGFASLAVIVTFFFGATFFVLGIIGEYIGRIFFNINQKPQYFIKEVYKINS